jgi:hypothetical protein
MACERSALKNIKRLCGGNAPGINVTIYYTPMSEFVTRPVVDATSGTVLALDLIATTGTWQTVEISNKDGVFKSNGKEGYFAPMIEGFHPRVNALSTKGFQAMLNQTFAVVHVDNNGNRDMNLDVEFEYDVVKDGSKNGYQLKFISGNVNDPVMHLASAVDLILL